MGQARLPARSAEIGTEVEPTIGIEPMNLFLTKEVLYLLSYVGLREAAGKRIGEGLNAG
jgi:hypothetical protein